MEPDYRSLPAITEQSFDFTVYPSEVSSGLAGEMFEGPTERLSRRHLRGAVTSRTSIFRSVDTDPVGREVRVKFHVISSALNQVNGRIVELEESEDFGNRPVVEIKFTRDLNLLELRL